MLADLEILRIDKHIMLNIQLVGYFKRHPYRTIAFLAIAASFLSYWAMGPGKLQFVELSSPKGFRALVLDGSSSRFDPVLGSLQGAATPGTAVDTTYNAEKICKALWRDAQAPTAGNLDTAINVVEFFDYRCPYCKTLTKILASLRADGRIRVIYKEWPILGESSQLAARAALAAARQGGYVAFHEKLMQSRFIPTIGYIEDLSSRLGINHPRLLKDMSSDEISAVLRRNHDLASKLGLVGTPALVVGRTIVEGAITQEQLERLIAQEMSSPPVC